ncbi:MAG: toxin HipA [Paucimonas sp.]|nr:toxin HipA [Paucimonas sp.]
MARELAVWLGGQRTGLLALVEGHLRFTYSKNWLASADARPLSQSLPLRSAPFDERESRPFFAGLLPEGRLRHLLARQFQVSDQNDFALLDRIGGECAGSVSLLELHQTPAQDAVDTARIRWLGEPELVSILDELPRRPMLAGRDGPRLSLAGAQDKLPVVVDGDRIGLPAEGVASTHILKPPIASLPDSVANEGFSLALARRMRLPAANARIARAGDRQFLLVERYDRQRGEGMQQVRLHQEDFCQALGTVPEMKYQSEGGPGLAQCFELVRRTTKPSAPQVVHLLDYVIFNALLGNHDAHGKNFSLLYTTPGPQLAPLYDALSTAAYPRLSPKMAMKLGGTYQFSQVQLRHWDRFAVEAGLSASQTRKRVLEFAHLMPAAARALAAEPSLPFKGIAVIDEIVAIMERRAALTIARLTGAN